MTAGVGWDRDSRIVFVSASLLHKAPGSTALRSEAPCGLRRCLRVPAEGAARQRLEPAPAAERLWLLAGARQRGGDPQLATPWMLLAPRETPWEMSGVAENGGRECSSGRVGDTWG